MVQQASIHSPTQAEFTSESGSKITSSPAKYTTFDVTFPLSYIVIASQVDFTHKPPKPQLQQPAKAFQSASWIVP